MQKEGNTFDYSNIAGLHASYGLPFPERDFREWFVTSWLQRKDDPDNITPPHQRKEEREAFYAYMQRIGWRIEDFDWNAWREYLYGGISG